MKGILKFIAVLVVLALVGIFLPFVLGFIVKDQGPVSDEALRLSIVPVSEIDNGYYDLMEAIKAIKYPTDDATTQSIDAMLAGTAWDGDLAKKVVEENSEALKYFSDAANDSSFQNPAFANPLLIDPEGEVYNLGAVRQLAKLSSLKALVLAHDKKTKAAIDVGLDAIRIGEDMERSQQSTLEYLTALSLKKESLSVISHIGTAKDRALYAKTIDQFESSNEDLVRVAKVEYATVLRGVDGAIKDKVSLKAKLYLPFYFQTNATKQLFADRTVVNMNEASLSCDQIVPPQEQKEYDPGVLHAIKSYFTKNAYGIAMYHELGWPELNFSSINLKRCEVNTLMEDFKASNK